MPSISNVEIVDIQKTTPGDIDLSSSELADVTKLVINGFDVNEENITTKEGDVVRFDAVGDANDNHINIESASDVESVALELNETGTEAKPVDIDVNGAGVTSLSMQADGDSESFVSLNTLAALEDVSITGTADLTANGDTTATSIDAGGATGDITVEFGTVAEERTITGGAGDDEFIENADNDLVTKTTIVGGGGTNTLTLKDVGGTALSTGSSGNVTNVSGIQELKFDTELTSALSIDVAKLAGLDTISFLDYNDAGTDVHAISNMNDGMTINVADADGDADAATDTDAELSFGFATNSSDNNATINLQGVQILKLNNSDGFADTITLNSADDAAGNGDANILEDASSLTAKKLIITGDQKLDMDTSNALATSVTSVDASELTGILEIQASTTGTEITGGSADDLIKGGSGADVLNGGDGDDTIDGKGGNDTINAGAGDDTIVLSSGNDSIDGGAGDDTLDVVNGSSDTTLFNVDAAASNVIDLNAGTITLGGSAAGGSQTITNVTDINASAQENTDVDLTLVGDDSDNTITAGEGKDTLTGNGGDDRFVIVAEEDYTITDFDDAGDDELYFNVETSTLGSLLSDGLIGTSAKIITGSASSTASLQTLTTAGDNLDIANAVQLSGIFGGSAGFANATAFTGKLESLTTGVPNSTTVLAFGLNTAGTELYVAEVSNDGGDSDNEGDAATVKLTLSVENIEASDIFIF